MSAIGGIYNTDGAPVDRGLLSRMRDIVDYRGPDGSGLWADGNLGLVHRLLWNTEESVYEKQPLTNGRGLWITADCRIDNRDELKREFVSRGFGEEMKNLFDPHPAPDSAYILFAYQCWDEDASNHLLGDFAFAIWDERQQKLFCARDPLGLKPFVYHWNEREFLFGSEIKQIFQNPGISRKPNSDFLAEFLLMIQNSKDTPYASIRRLPPGYWIRIRGRRFEIKRYWHWNPEKEPESSASLEENAEIFLNLFQDAVKVRLRTPPRMQAGSLLSGGLDSSSIASVAARILRGPLSPAGGGFPVFTLRFPEANPTYELKNSDPVDESLYSEAVIHQYSMKAHLVEIKGWGPLENWEENFWHQEVPIFSSTLTYFVRLFRSAGERGVRVLLHGEGGDEVFRDGPYCFMKEFKKGNVFKFFREWRSRRGKSEVYSIRNIFNTYLRSLLPAGARVFYRRLIPRQIVPDWIDPVFAKKIHLEERIGQDFQLNLKLNTSTSGGILSWIFWQTIPYYFEMLDRAAASIPFEIRLPFADLRIFRFCSTLPWDQKTRGGISKFLLRRAMKGVLPERVSTRARKSEFAPVARGLIERYALPAVKETFENPQTILRSIILPGKVRSLFDKYFLSRWPPPPQIRQSFHFLWHLTSVNQWVKYQNKFEEKLKEVPHGSEKNFFFAEKN